MVAVLKTLDAVMSWLCMALTGILTFLVILAVVLRYWFDITFTQMEEAICVLFSAMTFLGAALGIREKSHITVPALGNILGAEARKWMAVASTGVVILVSSVVLWTSVLWILRIGGTNSLALQIPCGYYYCVVPVSFSILVFYCCVDLLSTFMPIPEAEKGYLSDGDLAGTDFASADAGRGQS